MKKVIATVALCLIICASIAFATFTDIPKFESYKTAIEFLVKRGVISGYEDNTFRPENRITRAEFTKMIITALGETCEEPTESKFSDVEANFWATKYINKAEELKLVNGYEDGTFKPQNEITYSEVAAVIIRAMGKEDIVKGKNGVINMPDYMNTAYDLNLFDGVVTNDLVYLSPARRDNVALMIYNMLNYEERSEAETEKEDTKETVTDTKLLYVGFVRSTTIKNGEISFSIDNGEDEFTITYNGDLEDFPQFMKKISREDITSPEKLIGMLLVYKVDSKGNISLSKALSIDEIKDIATLVTDVDEELILLEDDKIFDTGLEKYEGIKLNKCYFYIVEYGENREGTVRFENAERYALEKLKVKKDDRIHFSEDGKICLVFREI